MDGGEGKYVFMMVWESKMKKTMCVSNKEVRKVCEGKKMSGHVAVNLRVVILARHLGPVWHCLSLPCFVCMRLLMLHSCSLFTLQPCKNPVFYLFLSAYDCLMRAVSFCTTRLNLSIVYLPHHFLPFLRCPYPSIHFWLQIIITMCDPSVVGQTANEWYLPNSFGETSPSAARVS